MTDLGPYTEKDFVMKSDYFDDLNKTEGMLKALMNQLTEHDRKIAALERRDNEFERDLISRARDILQHVLPRLQGYDHHIAEAWLSNLPPSYNAIIE